MESRIKIPPIVGVPIFLAWFSGANELTAWPYFKACSLRIMTGPSTKPMVSAVNTLNSERNVK